MPDSSVVSNPKNLFWGKAFIQLKSLNSVVTLFYLHRGVSFGEIFWLSVVWSITAFASEVPTGYLADRFGRKHILLLGAIVDISSTVAAVFAHGFLQFAGVFVLMAFAFTCFSGADEAILYDSLKMMGKEKDMTHFNGRLASANSFFKILFPAIGALLASGLQEGQFLMLLAIDGVTSLLSILFYSRLVEPTHATSLFEQERTIWKQSLHTLKSHPILFRFAFNRIGIFVVSFLIFRAYQPALVGRGLGGVWLAVFYFLFHASTFCSAWYLGSIERLVGAKRLFTITASVVLVGLVGILLHPPTPMLFLLYLFVIVCASIREPMFSRFLNAHIKSESRATTLSQINALKGFIDIPVLLLVGFLVNAHPDALYVIGIILCVSVLVFSPIRRIDIAALEQVS